MRAGAAGKNVVLAPLAFVANQVMVMNPLLAPVWLAGAHRTLGGRPFRALALPERRLPADFRC